MKIAWMLLYHYPEKVSSYYLYQDVMDGLIEHNHEVHIITPNPVRGISKADRKKYLKIKEEKEKDGQFIKRVNLPFDTDHTKVTRALRAFLVSYFCAKGIKKMKPDCVIVQSDPPVFYAYYVSRICKKLGIPVIYMIQDLYPDILKSRGIIYKFLNYYQKKALSRASQIVTISEDMKDLILKKGISENKIEVIHNWVYQDEILNYDLLGINQLPKESFYVVYSGNIGYMQNMDIIIESAKKLVSYPISFLFVGDGNRKDDLIDKIKNLKNCYYISKVDFKYAESIYSFADVNLITLRDNVIYSALPSKTSSCIKVAKPIIACVNQDSKYAKMISNYELGVVVDPNDSNALAKEILNLYQGKLIINSKNNLTLYEKLFDKDKNVNRYIKLVNQLIEKS